MSFLLLYIPICLVILLVLETCKQDEPKKIARRAFINFGILTAVLLAGCVIVYGIQKWL